MFQTLSVAYASEVCPVSLRGYLTTYANICWVIGQVLSSGVLRGFLGRQDEWAYRIPFALQWVFPPPILLGVIFAPESPWWLVRVGREEDAAKVVKRLMSKKERADENAVNNTISAMKLTNEHEKALSAGTSYLDCFKGIDLRRTEVACLTWACQNMCGSAFMGYSTYFYKMAGLPTEQAFNLSLAQYALGFFGTVGSWGLMAYLGRRTLYTGGLFLLLLILVGIGGAGFAPPNATIIQARSAGGAAGGSGGTEVRVNTGASWAVGSMLLVYTLIVRGPFPFGG
jgi:MFS transporter, SP family, general alpha glucoside:H+ symporter